MNRNIRLGRRTSMLVAVRTAVETLENRRMMDATYQTISPTAFTQDWTNTAAALAVNDDWSGVAGIIGYRGDDIVGASPIGVDPQTVLTPRIDAGDTPAGVVDLIVDPATPNNPNTFISGGVAEFSSLTDPVVGFQGSGTADAPFLLFHINSTGVPVVRVQYRLRDIDGSADNAIQAVALQYRVGNTGDFTNVASAFVADASTGPTLADAVFNVNAVLPANAGNQAQLQIRVITTNAGGSDEWIGVDNINVSAGSTAGTFNFASNGLFTTLESAGSRTITINRDDGSTGAASVRARTILGGSATADSDYTVVDTIVPFINGQTSATFDIPILQDTEVEGAESVFLSLSDPTGGAQLGGLSSATLLIGDDDSTAPAGVLVNELNINPPTAADAPFEYAEIRGGNAQQLRSVYFVSIEGEADLGANPGNVSFIQDLSSFALGSNGLLVIKAQTGGHAIPAATTLVTSATLSTISALQNGSNTYAIIFSPLPIVIGSDLDSNNDGTLDLGPGASVLDGIGWIDGTNLDDLNPDRVYAPRLTLNTVGLPTLPFARDEAPDIATRFPDALAANNADAWYYGEPNQATGTNADITYVVTQTTNPAGIPAGTPVLTPGAPNYPQPVDTIAPTLDVRTFVFDAAPTPQTVQLTFSENVAASLSVSDLTLNNLTTASTIAPANIALSYNAGTNVASITFPGFANGILPDGIYELTITGVVEDAAGNDVVAATPFNFFALGGDANRDRTVNLDDFTALASSFGTGGRTVSTGDFTYDGTVNLDDFTILAANFGTTLPPTPASLPRVSTTALASPFSASRIEKDFEFEPIRNDIMA